MIRRIPYMRVCITYGSLCSFLNVIKRISAHFSLMECNIYILKQSSCIISYRCVYQELGMRNQKKKMRCNIATHIIGHLKNRNIIQGNNLNFKTIISTPGKISMNYCNFWLIFLYSQVRSVIDTLFQNLARVMSLS